MEKYTFTLEEIEYLLVKNNCEYFYGFYDTFMKYDREKVDLKFEKIAEGLENKKIISRDFKGNITCSENIDEILDNIINVEIFYDINVIDVDKISEKYRIYRKENSFIVIKIISNDKNELDYENLSIFKISINNINNEAEKLIDKLLKYDSVNDFSYIEIPTYLYNEIMKMSEDKYFEKVKIENEKEQMAYKILHRVVSRCSKVISVTITDMKKRKSKSYMYVNGLKKLLCMEFKIDSDNNKWMINAVNKEVQNDEIRKILQV